MRGLRQATRVTCRAGLRCGLSNNGWDILENSSVQPNIPPYHPRTLPLYTSERCITKNAEGPKS